MSDRPSIFTISAREFPGRSYKDLSASEKEHVRELFKEMSESTSGSASTSEKKKARPAATAKKRTAEDAVKSIEKQKAKAKQYATTRPKPQKEVKAPSEKHQDKGEVASYFNKKWGNNKMSVGKKGKVEFTMNINAMGYVPRSNREEMESFVDLAATIAMAAGKHTVKIDHVLIAVYAHNRLAKYIGADYVVIPNHYEYPIPAKMLKFDDYSSLTQYIV